MNNKSIKHDIDSASITLKRFTSAIKPAMQDIIDYMREQKAHHVASQRQLDILERSMNTIEQEADQLASLAQQLIKDSTEVDHEQQSNS